MPVKQKIMLDVGCGANCTPGYVGMDIRDLPGVQIVHDIEIFPWPLDDESCAMVVMSHLVEHIKPWLQLKLMDEVWRVLEPEGYCLISTPYGGSFRYNQDPTHCSPWNEATVEYFVAGTLLYQVYKPKPWKVDRLFWDVRGDLEVAYQKLTEETEGDNGKTDS